MKQTILIVLIIISLSLAMTGCVVPDSNYVSKEGCVQFPIIVTMDGFCYTLSGDGNIDLRRDDGQVFYGEWELISNDSGCISFRIDIRDCDAYPATLTIYGNKKAEIWITSMGDSKIYGKWY